MSSGNTAAQGDARKQWFTGDSTIFHMVAMHRLTKTTMTKQKPTEIASLPIQALRLHAEAG